MSKTTNPSITLANNSWQQQQNQQSIRLVFQQLYKQKLKQIQSYYSEQNKSLKKTLQQAYKKVLTDQLLLTMIGDKTTSKFIQQRVEQCFQQIVYSEREIIIENQNIQIAEMRFKVQEVVRDNENVRKQCEQKCGQMRKQVESAQKKASQLQDVMIKMSNQLKNSNQSIRSLQQSLAHKDNELKSYLSEFQQLREQNIELKSTLQHIDSQLKLTIDANVQKYQNQTKQIAKYQHVNAKLQKRLKEMQNMIQQMQAKSKRSIAAYKQKIDQYKQKMTQLINSTKSSQSQSAILENKSTVTASQSELQKRLSQTIQQHERRFQLLKEQKQKQRNELQRKYENRHKQTQQYYEKLLEKKVSQVQAQAGQFWDNIKRQQNSLRETIQNYEDNFMLIQEHVGVLRQRQQLIVKMKQKLQEYEGEIDTMEERNTKMEGSIEQLQTLAERKSQQIAKLQNALTDQLTVNRRMDQMNAEMKGHIKKLQSKISSLQQQLDKQIQKLSQQKQSNNKLSQDLASQQKQIKQKELKIKDLIQQQDSLERKSKKLQNQLLIVNNNYNDITQLFKQNKKYLSQLQYKIKHMEHENQLIANQYNHKIKKLTEELVMKNQEIKNITMQYKTMQDEYLSLKSNHTEMQTINKKLGLEIKYFKETQTTMKGDYSVQVIDLKNRVQQKNAQIEWLKKQIENRQKLHNQRLKQISQQRKILQNRIKQYRKAFNLMKKLTGQTVTELSKQIDTLKSIVRNSKTVYENQLQLFRKTFAIQQLQIQRNFSHVINEKLLKQTLKFQDQKKSLQQKTLQEKKQLQTMHSQKLQKQKESFFNIVQQKQKSINNLSNDNRNSQYEMQRNKQQLSNMQKAIHILQTKLMKQEQEFNKKLNQLGAEYENDKNQIIEQYKQKRDISNSQMQQLAKVLQKLRIQIQSTKSNYEEQKLMINSQLRSVQQQQLAVREVVLKKQEQLKRLDEQYRKMTEQRNHLQATLRQFSEHDQRKVMRIHELQFMENQLNQSLSLTKVKLQRLEQQNTLIKQSMKEHQQINSKQMKLRIKAESQLKDIKAAIDRNDKFRDLRALQQMTVETQELTNKVNQMKKMSQYLERTPLRS